MEGRIDQMLNGHKRTEIEHEGLIYKTSLELAESYDIFFDGENIIPDMNMSDRLFAAAIDLLDEIGVLCMDTSRVTDVNKEEIKRSIKNTCHSFSIGQDSESTTMSFRDVLDARMPNIISGPIAVPITDELYIPAHRSYAKINLVSAISPGSFHSLDTKPYVKDNPLNISDAQIGVKHVKEACRLEGRPELCSITPPYIDDVRAAISIANPKFMGAGDLQEIFPIPFLKTDMNKLSMVTHYKGIGSRYISTSYLTMGALTSSTPEQFAIQIVAEMLKNRTVYSAPLTYVRPSILKDTPSRSLAALWTSFIASMAITRNSRLMHGITFTNSSGPCTESMMYETAVQTIGSVICGADSICGPVPNQGSILNHVGGLDALFMANIADFATSLSLNDANHLCLELYSKYANQPPESGKAFDECYDLKKIEPSDEYYEVYDEVTNQIYDIMGTLIS